jgi:hypothetical protein
MNYLKSILVGAAAFMIPLVLYAASVVIWARYYVPTVIPPPPPPQPSSTEVGFTLSTSWVDTRFPVPAWVVLLLGVLAFGIAFRWMVRRAASQPVGFWKKLASACSELLAGCTLALRSSTSPNRLQVRRVGSVNIGALLQE